MLAWGGAQPCQNYRVNEATRRLLYNILRCPNDFLTLLKKATEDTAWNLSGQHVEVQSVHLPLR